MHKKPVHPGRGSGAVRRSWPLLAALGAGASTGFAGGAARLALAFGLVFCLDPGGAGSGAGWSWGPSAAWADGDPIVPASETSPDPVSPSAPAAVAGAQSAKPAAEPAQAAPVTPAAPVPATAPPAATNSPEATGREDRFRDLERRTFELKDQVFRAKARLTLLNETLVSANVGTTRAVFVHQNHMGRLFQPIRVSYQIDGREIFTKEDAAGVLGEGKELVVWEGGLKPGDHTVGVTVVYRGNGAKVFAYYDKYNFTARAAHRLTAVEGQTTRLVVRCYEKGTALTAKLEDRPEFEFKVAGAAVKASGDGKPGTAPPSRPADATSTEAKAK